MFGKKHKHIRRRPHRFGGPSLLLAAFMVGMFAAQGSCLNIPDSIAKAKRDLDSLQKAYIAQKFGMFLHFNMSTFTKYSTPGSLNEWDRRPPGQPDQFNPTDLDCGQWADVAVAAQMRYMVLVTKHHGGFCLWPSETTKHDVASCVRWKDGEGDVVREFVDSARSRGLNVGLYFSIEDWNYPCGKRTCGVDSARQMVKDQLTELLTRYGKIECLWFDKWGWKTGSGVTYNTLPYDTIYNHVKSIQPHCLMIENNHLINSYTKMSSLPDSTIPSSDIRTLEAGGGAKEGNDIPTEWGKTYRSDGSWFWHPKRDCSPRKTSDVINNINHALKTNSTYLLNLTPDTTGNIPQCIVDSMKKVGSLLPENFNPLVGAAPYAPRIVPSAEGIGIYRRPGSITVRHDEGRAVTASLIDLRGATVVRKSASSEVTIRTGSLSTGTYLLKVSGGKKQLVQTMVITADR